MGWNASSLLSLAEVPELNTTMEECGLPDVLNALVSGLMALRDPLSGLWYREYFIVSIHAYLAEALVRLSTLASRIGYRRPYSCVGRFEVSQDPPPISELRNRIAKKLSMTLDEIVIRLGKGYGGSADKRTGEWLDLHKLQDEEGAALKDHAEYNRQIEHFMTMQDKNPMLFWVFTPKKIEPQKLEMRDSIRKEFKSVLL